MYDKVEREYKVTLLGDAEELEAVEERLRELLSEVKDESTIKKFTFEMVSDTPIDEDEEVPDVEEEEEEEDS